MVFAATDNAGRPYALKRMLAESRDRPLLQAEIDILVWHSNSHIRAVSCIQLGFVMRAGRNAAT